MNKGTSDNVTLNHLSRVTYRVTRRVRGDAAALPEPLEPTAESCASERAVRSYALKSGTASGIAIMGACSDPTTPRSPDPIPH
jgi:hypothetical protein